MKITELTTQLDDFFRPMKAKYGLTNFIYDPGKTSDEPCIFFGFYFNGDRVRMLRQRTGIVVIVWAGSDSMRFHKNYGALDYFHKNRDRVFHIAYSHWIKTDLDEVGLDYFEVPIFPVTFPEHFKPVPLGPFVYHYTSSIGSHQWFYGTDTIEQIEASMGDNHALAHKFLITNFHAHPREKLHEVYAKCFVGVRLTSHDNMAISCVEMSLMGRRSIFNGNIPGAIPWEERSDVLPLIIEEYQYDEPDKLVAEEMRAVINLDQAHKNWKGTWLDTDFYK